MQTQLREAIILAGGLGTRLRSITEDIPKPMAKVGTRPFLAYLLDYLEQHSAIQKVILSVGYKHQTIQDYFQNKYKSLEISYSIEDAPLGTGGAISQSLSLAQDSNILILNGDTFFAINLQKFQQQHFQHQSQLSLALKSMSNFDRYGTVQRQKDNTITKFIEKQKCSSGTINAGLYIINKNLIQKFPKQPRFSFEKDFMEPHLAEIAPKGFLFEGYFIDIGIPQDYHRANNELPKLFQDGTTSLFSD